MRFPVHLAAAVPALALLLLPSSAFSAAATAAGGGGRPKGPLASLGKKPAFAPKNKKNVVGSSSSSTTTASAAAAACSSSSSDTAATSSATSTTSAASVVDPTDLAHGGSQLQPAGEETFETVDAPLSQSADVDTEGVDAPLMADIEMLSGMLAEVVRRDNSNVHDLYTVLRKLGMDRAADPNDAESIKKMKKVAYDLTPQDTLGVMRIFSVALNLVNAAEVHHRLRVMREHELSNAAEHVGPLPMSEDSVRGTIEAILDNDEGGGVDAEEIFKKLCKQKVEIVLTAHPTEVNRKTLLRKYRKVTETLSVLDRTDLHPYERTEALTTLKRLIAAIWGSDEIRRKKPTPQQEAAGGNAVIESVLWDAVPAYLRKLDAQCRVSLGKSLPVDVNPIRFASWIGGDRDGNPNVTPEVTREVVTHQRLRAARLLLGDMNELYNELAISSRFSPELEELAATMPESTDIKEKYRKVVGHLRSRLVKTMKVCEAQLRDMNHAAATNSEFSAHFAGGGWDDDVVPVYEAVELYSPLRVMYDSLMSTGFELVAEGRLSDILRRLSVFGMTLVPLDIREESTRHTIAMDAITRYLGVGSYKEWDESDRLNFLQSELTNKRPMFRTRDVENNIMNFDPDVIKTLRTFKVASELGVESLGAYVISQAQTASDVLAVMVLQKQFGMTSSSGKMMRVVPLFETLNDLTNAPVVLNTLFNIPGYVGACKGKQEVMVGYSDSAKDAGRLAACWAQYTSQEKMAAVAEEHSIKLTFFHGKGGTVGRGGNPALYRAILSHPPNTINGRFRVTEQGEMITQNFGSPNIAERSLDIYTAAVLREAFTKHVEPTPAWRSQMSRISTVSCKAYRQLVREEPRFVPYFRQATPELELGSLNIGSRPAKRNPKGGIESLRAIPWTFAWTQTRLHLSAWLGVGEGLNPEDEKDREELKEMYTSWPWFRETIDLVAMILSKTDFSISANYDATLVNSTDSTLIKLGDEVRTKLVQTRQAVLDVTGSQEYGGTHVMLLRASSKIRNPYVDAINMVQAELLREIRAMPDDDDTERMTEDMRKVKEVRRDALISSIAGIAQGMRNSG